MANYKPNDAYLKDFEAWFRGYASEGDNINASKHKALKNVLNKYPGVNGEALLNFAICVIQEDWEEVYERYGNNLRLYLDIYEEASRQLQRGGRYKRSRRHRVRSRRSKRRTNRCK
jgi:hypothetical protein